MKQIDKGFKTVEREIFDGGVGIRDVAIGRNNLRIIKVWQHSEMKEIKAYGTNGIKTFYSSTTKRKKARSSQSNKRKNEEEIIWMS